MATLRHGAHAHVACPTPAPCLLRSGLSPSPPTTQDRQFFETLYTVLIALLDEAFGRLGKRADIEREVGEEGGMGEYSATASSLCADAQLLGTCS